MSGDCQRYDSFDEDNFTQCGIFFRDVLNEEEKERLVDNIASHIKDAQGFLQASSLISYSLFEQSLFLNIIKDIKHLELTFSVSGPSCSKFWKL